jgi:hypothetical protein
LEKYILKDGKGIDTEVMIEKQNTSFLNVPYCTQENKQQQNGLQKMVNQLTLMHRVWLLLSTV